MTLNAEKIHELRYSYYGQDKTVLVYGESLNQCIQEDTDLFRCHDAGYVTGPKENTPRWVTLGQLEKIQLIEVVPYPSKWFDEDLDALETITTDAAAGPPSNDLINKAKQCLTRLEDCFLHSPRAEMIIERAIKKLGITSELR